MTARYGPLHREPAARKANARRVVKMNLYEFIGAKPGASPGDIERLIQITRTRLQQTGKLYQGGNEERLEEAHRVLMDPLERAAYDEKHGIVRPVGPSSQPRNPIAAFKPTARRRQVMVQAFLLVLLVVVIGFFYLRHVTLWPTGTYLNSVVNGQRTAVFLKREAHHSFPNGKTMTACEVRMLDSGEIRWMSEKQLHAEFAQGPPAAPSDLKGP